MTTPTPQPPAHLSLLLHLLLLHLGALRLKHDGEGEDGSGRGGDPEADAAHRVEPRGARPRGARSAARRTAHALGEHLRQAPQPLRERLVLHRQRITTPRAAAAAGNTVFSIKQLTMFWDNDIVLKENYFWYSCQILAYPTFFGPPYFYFDKQEQMSGYNYERTCSIIVHRTHSLTLTNPN